MQLTTVTGRRLAGSGIRHRFKETDEATLVVYGESFGVGVEFYVVASPAVIADWAADVLQWLVGDCSCYRGCQACLADVVAMRPAPL